MPRLHRWMLLFSLLAAPTGVYAQDDDAMNFAPVSVEDRIVSLDMWVMLAVTVALALIGYLKVESGRAMGTVMLVAYGAYMITMV